MAVLSKAAAAILPDDRAICPACKNREQKAVHIDCKRAVKNILRAGVEHESTLVVTAVPGLSHEGAQQQ